MPTIAEVLASALDHHQAGRLAEAEQIYQQVVQTAPNVAEAWHLLGAVALQKGDQKAAQQYINRALSINPLLSEAHTNLGTLHITAGNLPAAEQSYRRALELDPNAADANLNLGIVLQQQGLLKEAVNCYERTLEFDPSSALAHFNLGGVARAQGELERAADCYLQSLKLAPDYFAAHANLGNVRRDQGRLDEAIVCYRQAIALQPNFAEGYNNLGNALRELGQTDEAIATYQRAVELDPNLAEAHCNLGNVLRGQGQLNPALTCYSRAIEVKRSFVTAHSSLLYLLHFSPEVDSAGLYEAHGQWNEQHVAPLTRLHRPHSNDRRSERRLRIGYVSPDFRGHCQAFFTTPLFSSHDRSQVEVVCYADLTKPDATTAQLRSLADEWRDITRLSDDQAAELIRQDRIDILVDLCMHMACGRPLLFARKPAPVQVCWLAYPGTTGQTAIDYRLTDPYLDPPGKYDGNYTEQSIRLPETFWCYDPLASEPAVGPLPASAQGYVTFGSLNSFLKINAATLKLWAGVLRVVERSRLLLLAPEGEQRTWVLDNLRDEGIAAERVIFVATKPRAQYLALYQQIDIILDPWPYPGHTTSLDAFWMGIPVVTLPGETTVGRGGISLLTNIELSDLIAETPEQFIRIAADLATDLPRLTHLRQTLRTRLEQSPLMDAPRFACHLETAYRGMWRRWCEKSRN